MAVEEEEDDEEDGEELRELPRLSQLLASSVLSVSYVSFELRSPFIREARCKLSRMSSVSTMTIGVQPSVS